jgi:hypothetical protein
MAAISPKAMSPMTTQVPLRTLFALRSAMSCAILSELAHDLIEQPRLVVVNEADGQLQAPDG